MKTEPFCYIFLFIVPNVSTILANAKISEKLFSVNKCSNSSAVGETVIKIPQHILRPDDRDNKSEVIFSLAEPRSEFKCTQEVYTLKFSTTELISVTVKYDSDFVNHSERHYFTSTGILLRQTTDEEYFMRDEYCINELSSSEIEVQVCPIPCGKSKSNPCVKKCCAPGKSVSLTTYSCKPSGEIQWNPIFYKDAYTKLSGHLHPHFVKSNPECPRESEDDNRADEEFDPSVFTLRTIVTPNNDTHLKLSWRLLADGSITYLGQSRKWTTLDVDNYCIDGILDFGEGRFFSGSPEDQVLIVCLNESEQKNLSMLYVVMMFVSSVFLLLTSSVYILLFDKQNIHGWTVLGLCSSMFLMYVFLASAHLLGMYRTNVQESGSPLCVTIGVLAHFFFLSTFCWLTLINFDLCWTFRALTPGTGRSKGFKRFLGYLGFAWTLPLAVVATGLILDKEFPDVESEVIVPEYGQGSCYITRSSQGYYLYYIIACLLSYNFILIAVTLITIYRLRRNSQIVLSSRYKLFGKLFVIMGVTWVFEIISWCLNVKQGIEWYWVVLDMINLLQSVAIFIIFVCKRSTLTQLSIRVPPLKKILLWVQPSNSNNLEKSNPTNLDRKTSSWSSISQQISRKFKSETKF